MSMSFQSQTKFIDNDLNQIGWVDDVLTLRIIFNLRITNLKLFLLTAWRSSLDQGEN